MEAPLISLGVALVAVVAALVAAVVLARQRPREIRAARSRHPAATPPVVLSLVRDGRDAHWRVEVRTGAPPTSVDILSYRAAGSSGPWENEPIIEPIQLEPAGWAVLPGVVVGRAPSYDVVLGWTEHRDDGDRTGSASLKVHESGPVVASPPGRQGGWIVTAAVIALFLVVAGAIVLFQLVDQSDDAVSTEPTAPSRSTPVSEPSFTSPASAPTTIAPTTLATVPPTSAPERPTPATTTPATTTPATTTPATTTPATTDPVGSRPSVTATGRIEDCRFGSDCLVVGFTIAGFDGAPSEYICEFADGERVSFTFGGDGAATACSARSAAPSITVEVAGVRSNTVSPDDLGPTEPLG